MLGRRLKGEPLQYIFGVAHFRNLILEVGPGVLIPRPETEELVDVVLSKCRRGAKVCDVGTGSGAIALAVATERPDTKVTAVEISAAALPYARKNIDWLRPDNLELVESDLLSGLAGRAFDVIAANLPYIAERFRPDLQREVVEWEPGSALFAGDDGLSLIRRLLAEAPRHMAAGACIILEISPEQKSELAGIVGSLGAYGPAEFRQDMSGKTRFCVVSPIRI